MSLLIHKKDTHAYEVPSKYTTKFVQVLCEAVRPAERGHHLHTHNALHLEVLFVTLFSKQAS